MALNYWLVFIVTWIVTLCITKRKNKGNSWAELSDVFWILIVGPLIKAGILCLLCGIFSSKVYEIKDNENYNANDYLFFYRDHQDQLHTLVPFTYYLSNESNKEVVIYPVYYGNTKEMNEEITFYSPKTFSEAKNAPRYFFKEAPKRVRVKNKSKDVRFILTYN
jgi:hypothetical protein